MVSDSVRFCEILSGGVRYSGASSSKGSSSNSFGPAQGPSSRVLHKGPWQGSCQRAQARVMRLRIYVIALSSAAPARLCVHLQPSSSRVPSSTGCEPGWVQQCRPRAPRAAGAARPSPRAPWQDRRQEHQLRAARPSPRSRPCPSASSTRSARSARLSLARHR